MPTIAATVIIFRISIGLILEVETALTVQIAPNQPNAAKIGVTNSIVFSKYCLESQSLGPHSICLVEWCVW